MYGTPKQQVYQLMIPRSGELRLLMLGELHSSCYAAHLGVKKTTIALLERFWWPNLALDVNKNYWLLGMLMYQGGKPATCGLTVTIANF